MKSTMLPAFAVMACALAILSLAPAGAEETPPGWLKRPGAAEFAKVWPREAFRRNLGGRAELNCAVSAQGLLEDCKVVSETPADMGFGGAALALAPKYVLRPAMVDGKAVGGARFQFGIRFEMQDEGEPALNSRLGSRSNPVGAAVLVVAHPTWARAPSQAQTLAAYPKAARPELTFGHVVLSCHVQPTGELRTCSTDSEEPGGQGFAAAAKTLVPAFQMIMGNAAPKDVARMEVVLPFHLMAPASGAGERVIAEPDWLGVLDPDAKENLFPARAAAAGLATGRVTLDCIADTAGRLHDCAVTSEDPANMDFGPAGRSVAGRMVLNPWTAGGQAADGAHVRFTVRVNKDDP
jgi:TonB family protein